MYSLTIPEARSLRSSCWQDWFLQEALRIHSFLSLSFWELLAILGVPWLAHRWLQSLPPFSQGLSPLCVCASNFLLFSLKKGHQLLGLGRILNPGWSNLKIFTSAKGFPGGSVVKKPLPMQGTRLQSLIQEDPTCHGATKSMCHSYWACALQPLLRKKRSHCSEKPTNRN